MDKITKETQEKQEMNMSSLKCRKLYQDEIRNTKLAFDAFFSISSSESSFVKQVFRTNKVPAFTMTGPSIMILILSAVAMAVLHYFPLDDVLIDIPTTLPAIPIYVVFALAFGIITVSYIQLKKSNTQHHKHIDSKIKILEKTILDIYDVLIKLEENIQTNSEQSNESIDDVNKKILEIKKELQTTIKFVSLVVQDFSETLSNKSKLEELLHDINEKQLSLERHLNELMGNHINTERKIYDLQNESDVPDKSENDESS